jgi:hypothetical protein
LTCTAQERILQAIDWNDFFVYWDVDGSYEIVRLSSVVLIAVSLSRAVVRYLNNNQLSGTLTSYIGQLTALNYCALSI